MVRNVLIGKCRFASFWSEFAIALLCFNLGSAVNGDESLDLPLSQGSIEKNLVQLIKPPIESDDSLTVDESGISISQTVDSVGVKPRSIGLTLSNSISGDFEFELDFDVESLPPPTSGWGQGLNIRLVTDDPRMPVMAFGCISNEKHPRAVMIQLTRQVGLKKIVRVEPVDFSSGKWIVKRTGRAIQLKVVKDTGETWESERFTCPTADIASLQVLCTRQERGNTPAKYRLRAIRLSATSIGVK